MGDHIDCLITTDTNKIVTGSSNGLIRIYNATCYGTFNHERTFGDMSNGEIKLMKSMNGNRLLTYHYQENKPYGDDERGTIWNLNNGESIRLETFIDRRDGRESLFYQGRVDGCAEVPGNMIAVSGYQSEAWEGLCVFNSQTGKLVHTCVSAHHRPHGMKLGTMSFGYLAVLGYCSYSLEIWKVTSEKCSLIDTADCQRAYCMEVLATGEVIIGGFQIQIFDIKLVEGIAKLTLLRTFENRNVIDRIIPIFGYHILTIDRGGCDSGIIRQWNLPDAVHESIYCNSLRELFGCSSDYNPSAVGLLLPQELFLYGDEKKIVSNSNEFQGKLKILTQDPIYEIHKNARLLAQARNSCPMFGLGKLPQEILVDIAALSGLGIKTGNKSETVKFADARKLAQLYYGEQF